MSQEFTDFEIDADFDGVQAMSGEFTLLPPGEYVFIVKHLKQQPSKKGNQMVVATFEVAQAIEVPNVENPDALVGQKAWGNYSLLPQAIGRLKQLMMACGAPLDKFRASNLLEAQFRGTLVHTQGEGAVGPDGVPLPAKSFANVVNERALEEPPVKEAAKPPIAKEAAKAPAAAKPTNGAARRA